MKTKNKNRIIGIAAYLIYAISFLWLYKRIVSKIFNHRKDNAVKKANERHISECKKIFVIQIGKYFITGTREELRRYNRLKWVKNKEYRRMLKNPAFNFDYRNAIIYETK